MKTRKIFRHIEDISGHYCFSLLSITVHDRFFGSQKMKEIWKRGVGKYQHNFIIPIAGNYLPVREGLLEKR